MVAARAEEFQPVSLHLWTRSCAENQQWNDEHFQQRYVHLSGKRNENRSVSQTREKSQEAVFIFVPFKLKRKGRERENSPKYPAVVREPALTHDSFSITARRMFE